MAKDRVLGITITGDASKARKALNDLDKSVGRSAKNTQSAGKKMGSTLAGLGLAAGIFSATKAFDESAKVAAQSEAVLKSTGNTANTTAAEMSKLAGAIAAKTGIDDESIQTGANQLAVFKSIRNELGKGNDIFDQATKLSVDLGVAMGTDTTAAAKVLGKALDDPVKGLGKLGKSYVKLSVVQKEQIARMVESGDKAGAQKIILEELARSVGGQAEAAATGMGKAQVAIDNLQESVGGALAPAMGTAAKLVGGLAGALGALPGPVQQGVVFAAAAAISWAKWGDSLSKLGPPLANVAGKIGLLSSSGGAGASGLSRLGSGAAVVGKTSLVAAVGIGTFVGTMELLNSTIQSNVDLTLLGKNLEGVANDTKNWSSVTDQFGGSWKSLADKINLVNDEVDSSRLDDVMNTGLTPGGLWDTLTNSDAKKAQNQLADLDGQFAAMITDGNVAGARDLFGQAALALHKQGVSTEDVARTFPSYFTAMDGVKTSTVEAKAAQDKQAESSKAQATELGKLATAADDATDRIKAFYDATTAGISTEIGAEAAIDAFAKSLLENGHSFNVRTEAGRANESALIAAKDAAVAHALEVRKSTNSSDAAALSLQGYADDLRKTAKGAGATDAEIELMIAQMGLTPKDIETIVTSNATAQEINFNALAASILRTPKEREIHAKLTGDEQVKADLALLEKERVVKIRMERRWGDWSALGALIYGGKDGDPATPLAKGGRVNSQTGLALVGEQGPELVTFGQSGMVHTASATKRMMSGSGGAPLAGRTSGGSSVIRVEVNVMGSVVSERDLTAMVVKGINEAQRRSTRPILAGVS